MLDPLNTQIDTGKVSKNLQPALPSFARPRTRTGEGDRSVAIFGNDIASHKRERYTSNNKYAYDEKLRVIKRYKLHSEWAIRLTDGETIKTAYPYDNLEPLIHSNDLITITPFPSDRLAVRLNDIVLAEASKSASHRLTSRHHGLFVIEDIVKARYYTPIGDTLYRLMYKLTQPTKTSTHFVPVGLIYGIVINIEKAMTIRQAYELTVR